MNSAPQSKSRRRAFKVFVSGITYIIGLIILFFVFRNVSRNQRVQEASSPLYLQEPGHERTGHRYLYDSRLGWRNIPGWKATTLGRKLTINSKGLRDREYPYEKSPEFKRVLVLGDSYAWGYGVSDEEIFTEVLEEELGGSKKKVEVLNAAVSGWGTDQEYLYFLQEGHKYSPDIVLLAFFILNDPINNVNPTQYGLRKPVFKNTALELVNVPVPKPEEMISGGRSEADPIDLTVAIIRKLDEYCRGSGSKLMVVKFGRFLDPSGPRLLDYEKKFEDALGKSGSPVYLDLDDEFDRRGISKEQLLKGNDDGHWNAYGHAQTAKIVKEFFEAEKLLECF